MADNKSILREAVEAPPGHKLVVVDLSGIELRLNNYLWMHMPAIEAWAKKRDADIYSMTASNLFGRPVNKKDNPTERQVGKTCIAEGELVLTDHGLIPIEQVSTLHKVWDGVEWVTHDGVVCQGFKEVITHDSLTATKDHKVYLDDGSSLRFDDAQKLDYRLARTGDGGRAIRLGEDHQFGNRAREEQGPAASAVHRLWNREIDRLREFGARCNQWMSALLAWPRSALLADKTNDCREAALHQPERSGVPQLWRARNPVQLQVDHGSLLLDGGYARATERMRAGPNRQQWALRTGQYPLASEGRAIQQPPQHQVQRAGRGTSFAEARRACIQAFASGSTIFRFHLKTFIARLYGTGNSGAVEPPVLQTKRRVWDILNAGPRHRFTVSGRLVSNLDLGCGYGAGYMALYRQAKKNPDLRHLITMQQMETFTSIWRKTHPEIVQGWKRCGEALSYIATGDDSYQIDPWGLLRIGKDKIIGPSGRCLYYPNLRQVEKISPKNGRIYKEWVYGVNRTKKTYAGSVDENIIQFLARDAFQEKVMLCKWKYNIRAALTVYDEMVAVVPEAQAEWALEKMLEVFCEPISWWPQVVLFAEGDIADNYADAK